MTEILRYFIVNAMIKVTMTGCRTIFLLCVFLWIQTTINAQIVPPIFNCINEDTLSWSPSTNSCGPFQSIYIWTSNQKGGPYLILDSILDVNITMYVDEGAPGGTYYYLTSNYDCPGLSNPTSDTLSNNQLTPPEINAVSVNPDGTVQISWTPSDNPEVDGYIIYKLFFSFMPIDTVFGTTYTDLDAKGDQQSEFYLVNAYSSRCGNDESGFADDAHKTILLQIEQDFCTTSATLNWSQYEGWNNNVQNEIWIGVNGATPTFFKSAGATDTAAVIDNLIADQDYCVAIKSIEENTMNESFSNTVCFVAEVVDLVDSLQITNVTYNQGDQIEISYCLDPVADYSELSLTYMNGNNENGTPLDFNNLNDCDQLTIVPINNTPTSFQLKAIDDCDDQILSTTFTDMRLQVADGENGITVDWTDFQAEGRLLSYYKIYRKQMNNTEEVGEVNISDFLDLPPQNNENVLYCYCVAAFSTDMNGMDTLISYTNTECVAQEVSFYIPNAFVPEGQNPVFKPEFTTINNIQEYSLHIYNRWGGKVFESSSPLSGWDGMIDGKKAHQDVYLYHIRLVVTGGMEQNETGDVLLIR